MSPGPLALVAGALAVTLAVSAPSSATQPDPNDRDVAISEFCNGLGLEDGAVARCGRSQAAAPPAPVYVSVDSLPAVSVPAQVPVAVQVQPASRPPCYWTEFVDPRNGMAEPVYVCGQPPAASRAPDEDEPAGPELAAIRRAALRLIARGGSVGATPDGRGLVNLETFFWVQGVGPRDTGLVTREGFSLRIRAVPEEVWWDFGDGARDGFGLGRPGRASDVRHTYRRLGVYTVNAWIGWRVVFTADGVQRELPGAFQTSLTRQVPVDELRAVLTG